MNIIQQIVSYFEPVLHAADELVTSDEEKLKLQNELSLLKINLAKEILDYEKQLNEKQAAIVKAEALGHSWLQRNWRPIAMLTFLTLIILDSFALLPKNLPNEAWALVKIGLGGYVIGRSVEKVAPAVTEVLGSKRKASPGTH